MRAATRTKTADESWTAHALDRVLRKETPRVGVWIDSSEQTPVETVDEILTRAWTEAIVVDPGK
jgi:hypothetical protein